jgi:hypothetical protein
MRGKMKGASWWWVAVFLVGMVIGWLLNPQRGPHVVHHVDVPNDRNSRACTLSIGDEKTILGRPIEIGEAYERLKCDQARDFDHMLIRCRCID